MNLGKPGSQHGQVLVIVAVAFTVLLGAAAIAVDLGNGQLQKRRLQNVADAAALAAADVKRVPVTPQVRRPRRADASRRWRPTRYSTLR